MVSSIAEVNEDSFGVPDMKETIGLGRETCPDVSSRGSEMLISKVRKNLGVSPRLVKCSQKPFFEHWLAVADRFCHLLFCRWGFLLGLLGLRVLFA